MSHFIWIPAGGVEPRRESMGVDRAAKEGCLLPVTLAKTLGAAILAAAALVSGCAAGGGPPRNDDVFNRIQPGMTQEEVRQLIGPPDETMRFPLSNTLSWDYRYQDTWGYMAMFYVTLDANGRVVSKISRRLNDGGDHSSN
jgi:outer membrane protein assembly factor BamE (lipoprotein component of BamABCDE complex)